MTGRRGGWRWLWRRHCFSGRGGDGLRRRREAAARRVGVGGGWPRARDEVGGDRVSSMLGAAVGEEASGGGGVEVWCARVGR